MTTTFAPPPAAVASAAVSDLRRARRRRRLGDASWGDLAYRAYTTSLAALVAVVFLSGVVGDELLDAGALERLAGEGPAWFGVLAAAVLLVGVRSGARGGPIALEAADVHHLLLGPADRRRTLRRPTIGVLGYGTATGLVVGGLAGSLVDQRVGGAAAPWVVAGALAVGTTAALALAAGVLTSSRVVPRPLALVAAWLLLAWAVADVALPEAPASPTSLLGRLAVSPLESSALGWLPVGVAVLAVVAALAAVGGISVEAARRRTALVGQLRFAVTQQDLRTVVLLRRQLASERPRRRPWFGGLPRPLARRVPVVARDLRSVARWPLVRIVRVLVLGAGAGLALRGVAAGTTPLFLLAGVALYVAALDATEPLGQDVDHPDLLRSLPVATGDVSVQHLVQPVLVLLVVGGAAVGAAAAVDPDPLVWRLGLLALLPGSLAAVGGALVTLLAEEPGGAAMTATPEVAGPRLLFRTVWPPLLSTIAVVPVVVGILVDRDGGDALSAAVPAAAVVAFVDLCVIGWVRYREDLRRAYAEATGATPGRSST
jgi:hypothetical protein